MNRSKVTTVLLVLNLVLVGAIGYLLKRLRDADLPGSRSLAIATGGTPALKGRTKVVTVVQTNEFNWRQLESEDYRTYIERLRSIGCPEQTIRDLIIADIDQLLAPRLQQILPRRKELHFWHPEEDELWNDFDHREGLATQREIDFEKREVIEELLGVDLVAERAKVLGQEDYYGRRLSFLPDKKRSQVRTLIEKYQAQELALREQAIEDGEPLSAEASAELRRLRQEQQAEIAKLLTPEEQQQLEWWLSPTANAVRHAVYGMDASQEEFLTIYQLRKAFDETWGAEAVELKDRGAREKWEQAKRELETQLRQKLGEQRYADYQRGQDPDYRQLNVAVTRFKLPRDRANQCYEVKRVFEELRQQVEGNATLTPEQREAAVKALKEESGKAVKEVLGETAFAYFARRSQGQWIRH